jgi:hypothetical protein
MGTVLKLAKMALFGTVDGGKMKHRAFQVNIPVLHMLTIGALRIKQFYWKTTRKIVQTIPGHMIEVWMTLSCVSRLANCSQLNYKSITWGILEKRP